MQLVCQRKPLQLVITAFDSSALLTPAGTMLTKRNGPVHYSVDFILFPSLQISCCSLWFSKSLSRFIHYVCIALWCKTQFLPVCINKLFTVESVKRCSSFLWNLSCKNHTFYFYYYMLIGLNSVLLQKGNTREEHAVLQSSESNQFS